MTEIIVKTQAELDAALARDDISYNTHEIIIDSPAGIWITIGDDHGQTVEASGSATVWASGSATVEASGSATVEASDSATVEATPYVAVHLFSARATVTGGVVIDIAALNLDNPETWCAYHGIEVTDGVATVYKAVDDRYFSAHGTCYKPGATPDAPDWQPTKICGQGLHFSPTPRQAQPYNHATAAAAKYVACGVAVADLIPLDSDKCKAPRVVRSCAEVDIDGQPLTTPKASLS